MRSRQEHGSVLPHGGHQDSGEVQTGLGPDDHVVRPGRQPATSDREGGGGGRRGRAGRVPPGALSIAILRATRGSRAVRPGRTRAGAEHGGAREGREAGRGRGDRPRLRAPRRRSVPQQRGGDRRRRPRRRALPEDAHPRRSGVLRKVLLYARRPRVPRVRHPCGADRDARLLGPVVSRGGAPHRLARGQRTVLSDSDRLAPEGEGDPRGGAARRLAHRPARPCDRERLLRRRRESGGTRAPRGHGRGRHRVLGLVVPRRSVRRDRRRGTP